MTSSDSGKSSESSNKYSQLVSSLLNNTYDYPSDSDEEDSDEEDS